MFLNNILDFVKYYFFFSSQFHIFSSHLIRLVLVRWYKTNRSESNSLVAESTRLLFPTLLCCLPARHQRIEGRRSLPLHSFKRRGGGGHRKQKGERRPNVGESSYGWWIVEFLRILIGYVAYFPLVDDDILFSFYDRLYVFTTYYYFFAQFQVRFPFFSCHFFFQQVEMRYFVCFSFPFLLF